MVDVNGRSLGVHSNPEILRSSVESVSGIPTDGSPASSGRLFSSVGGDPEFSLSPVYNSFKRVFSHSVEFPDGVSPLLFSPVFYDNEEGYNGHAAVGYLDDGEFTAWRISLISHFHAKEYDSFSFTCPDGHINKILNITNRAGAGIAVLYEGGSTPSSRGGYLARVNLPVRGEPGSVLSTVELWDESSPSPEGSQTFVAHAESGGSTFPAYLMVVRQRPDLEWDIIGYDLDATVTTYSLLHGLGDVSAVESRALVAHPSWGNSRFNNMHVIMDLGTATPDVIEIRIDGGTPHALSIQSTVSIPQIPNVIKATDLVYSQYGISLAVQTDGFLHVPYQVTAGAFSWVDVPTGTSAPLVALTPSSEGQTWFSDTTMPHMAVFEDGSAVSMSFTYDVGYTEPFRISSSTEISTFPYAMHDMVFFLLARYGDEWAVEASMVGSNRPISGPVVGYHEYWSNAWMWDPDENLSFVGTGPYEPSLINANFSTCATPHRGKIWSFYQGYNWAAQSVVDGQLLIADPMHHSGSNYPEEGVNGLFLEEALYYLVPGFPESLTENDVITDIDFVTCVYNDGDGIILGTFSWEASYWEESDWVESYGTFLKLTDSPERGIEFIHAYNPVSSESEIHQDFYNNGVAFLGKSNGTFYAASGYGNFLTGDVWKLDENLKPISSIHLDPPHASEWEFAQMGIEPESGDFFLLTWYGLHRYTPTGTLLKSMYFVDLDAGEWGIFDDTESYWMDFDDDSPMNMIFRDNYVYVKFSYSEATHKGTSPTASNHWTNSGPGVLRIDIDADPWIKTFGPDGTVHWRANNIIYGGSGGGLFLYEDVQPFVSSLQALPQRTIFV